MFPKIPNVLLDPEGGEGGGGKGEGTTGTVVTAPIVSPTTSIQISALKGSSSPIVHEKVIEIPANIKGTEFSLSDEDEKELDKQADHPEAHKLETKGIEAKEKKKEEIKEEKKEELKEEKKEIAKVEEKKEVRNQQQKKVDPRDYSIFPEEVRGYLKNTSNESFNFIKDIYPKYKQAEEENLKLKEEHKKIEEGGFPSQWQTHPEAWRLHPAANRLFNDVQKIEFEENFWREQVKKINAGEPYVALQGYTKDGTPVYSQPIPPTEESKDNILVGLGQLAPVKANAYAKIDGLSQQFKLIYDAESGNIAKLTDEMFPWHKDPKDPKQEFVKGMLDALPDIHRTSPLAYQLSLLYAQYQQALQLLGEKNEFTAEEKKKEEIKKLTEPNVSSPTVSGALNNSGSNGANIRLPQGAKYIPPATFSNEGMD